MEPTTVEQRLAALELEVDALKRSLQGPADQGQSRIGQVPRWIDAIKGSLKDEPDFAEVLRLGRMIRASDPPSPADDGTP